jgi:hypothetical protein
MSITRQEFTNAGRDMLGRANAGETLSITRVVIGSGRATASSDLFPLIDLISPELDIEITQKTDQGDGVLLIDAVFNSDQASRAFELCEVGVMAHIGTEADRLYSVANVLATGADFVDPDAKSIHAFKIKVVIDRAPNVEIVIGESRDILAENIGAETVGPGVFKEKIANTLRFKRLVEGTSIELLDDGDSVTIGTKTLRVDLDLYVPLTHPDAPSQEVAFPTIQEALDYLSGLTIPDERRATINVAEGRHIITQTITPNHPSGRRIWIKGRPVVNMPITVAGGYDLDNSGNKQFRFQTLNALDYARLSVGDVAAIVSDSGSYIFDGAFPIVTLGGFPQVTLMSRCIRGSGNVPPPNSTNNCRFFWWPTQLVQNTPPGQDMLLVLGGGVNLQDIAITGQAGNIGRPIQARAYLSIYWCGITESPAAREALYAIDEFYPQQLFIGNSAAGLYCGGPSLWGSNPLIHIPADISVFVSSCAGIGIWATDMQFHVRITGNGTLGIFADQFSSVRVVGTSGLGGACWVQHNSVGLRCEGRAGTQIARFLNNSNGDLVAWNLALIMASIADDVTANEMSPPPNVIANNGSIIVR